MQLFVANFIGSNRTAYMFSSYATLSSISNIAAFAQQHTSLTMWQPTTQIPAFPMFSNKVS